MIIFIDDSGDPGFKIQKGSSKFFVISLVIFDDELEAEKVAISIKDLRREFNFSDKTEFKFCKSNKKVRQKFLEKICKFKFRIRSLVVDKSIIKHRIEDEWNFR